MKDYISRDVAINHILDLAERWVMLYGRWDSPCARDYADEIDRVPAADVAPVVRCKDCKYIAHFTDGHIECRLLADLRPVPCTYLTMKEDDYCSYGERRDADAD